MHKLIKNSYICEHKSIFCIRGQNHPLILISGSHSLTVSDYRVGVNDEFDRRPVYLGERFKASWCSCLLLLSFLFFKNENLKPYTVIKSEDIFCECYGQTNIVRVLWSNRYR